MTTTIREINRSDSVLKSSVPELVLPENKEQRDPELAVNSNISKNRPVVNERAPEKKGCLSCLKNIFTRNNNRLEQAVEEMGLINNNNETETLPGRPFENISTLEPINISDPIRLLAKSNINYYDKLFTIEQFSTMEYQLLRNALYNKDPFSSSGMQRIGFLTEERLVNFLANNMDAVIPEDKSGILLAPHQVVILEVLVNSNLPPQGRTLDEAFVN